VFEPFARILNVTAYEPSEAPVNHAVGIGLRRATRVFSITLVRKPKVVEFQATSNSLAPPLNVRALDDDGSELEVSIVSTTYVTRLGFTFRRDHFTVTSSTGVASLEVDESTNLRFGYYVDDLLLVE
jgi:hypothetical protein